MTFEQAKDVLKARRPVPDILDGKDDEFDRKGREARDVGTQRLSNG